MSDNSNFWSPVDLFLLSVVSIVLVILPFSFPIYFWLYSGHYIWIKKIEAYCEIMSSREDVGLLLPGTWQSGTTSILLQGLRWCKTACSLWDWYTSSSLLELRVLIEVQPQNAGVFFCLSWQLWTLESVRKTAYSPSSSSRNAASNARLAPLGFCLLRDLGILHYFVMS